MHLCSDEELIVRYQSATSQSDQEVVFGELFERYRDRVTRWCSKFTNDYSAAPDLTQEVFLRTYRGLNRFRGGSRFSTWIYVVTRNHCRSVIEHRLREPAYVESEIARDLPDPCGMQVYTAIERTQAWHAHCRVVRQALTPLEFAVIKLHYGNELSLAEVRRQLRLTNPSGAKAYIVSARRKLKKIVWESPGPTVE